MKIEVGKLYRSRNGRKARIYATDGEEREGCIHGALLDGSGWWTHSWLASGIWIKDAENGEDLISKWRTSPKSHK